MVTDLWKTNRRAGSATVFTSVANWSTSGQKDITWRGKKYLWSKSREFLRFVSAPKRARETFELATNMKEPKTRARFERNGWRLVSPVQISVDVWLYRDYIQRSKGEVSVAKDQYVRLIGWFSDAGSLSGGRATGHSGNRIHQAPVEKPACCVSIVGGNCRCCQKNKQGLPKHPHVRSRANFSAESSQITDRAGV